MEQDEATLKSGATFFFLGDRGVHAMPVLWRRRALNWACVAREVFLSGDFNEWSTASLPMIRRPDNGHWEKRLTLAPGRYEYKFIVDGEWIHNPDARENVPNQDGSQNSVLEVRRRAS